VVVERDDLGFDAPAPLGHPARKGIPEGKAPGLKVGEPAPDFTLPDAFGNSVNFSTDRGKSPAAIVFFRSAVW
jgi:hypothetical protein